METLLIFVGSHVQLTLEISWIVECDLSDACFDDTQLEICICYAFYSNKLMVNNFLVWPS